MADTALNPRQRVDRVLGRPLEFYLGLKGEEKRRRIGELLDMVELPTQLPDAIQMSCPADRSSG